MATTTTWIYREFMARESARPFRRARSRANGARGGPDVAPTGPPFEQVAADLRRLHTQLETLPAGTSWVRATGIGRAYDQLLATACQQLDVCTRILELPDGKPRVLERLRLEFLLSECGLQI